MWCYSESQEPTDNSHRHREPELRTQRLPSYKLPAFATKRSVGLTASLAVVTSVATWALAVLLSGRYTRLDELLEGATVAVFVVTGSFVGSAASLFLWQLGDHRLRWVVLGGGLFVAACAQAAVGIHQMEAADAAITTGSSGDPIVGLQAPATLAKDLPVMGLLGTAGGLLWLALFIANQRVTGGRLRPIAAIASLAVGSLGSWVASALLDTLISPRSAGEILAAACVAGTVWLVARLRSKWRISDVCFAISLLTLSEAGASQATLSSATLVSAVFPAVFRIEALGWCLFGVVTELNRGARANRVVLREERERSQRFESQLANSEFCLQTTRHEVRSALLLLNCGVELLPRVSRFSTATVDPDAVRILRQAGSRVAAAVGESLQADDTFDVHQVLDIEIRAARHRGLSVHLKRPPGVPYRAAGDPTVLSRVVGELLDNATRHAPGADVVVILAGHPSLLHITVADNGPGIALGDKSLSIDQLWSPPIDRRPSGGIGLPGARRLLESVGGSLTWERFQPGTVMTIHLPALHARSIASPAAPTPAPLMPPWPAASMG